MQFIYDEHYTVLHKGFAKRCVIKLSLWDKNEFQTNVWKRKRTKIKGKENFFFSVKVSRKFYFQLLLVISNDINPFELLEKTSFIVIISSVLSSSFL